MYNDKVNDKDEQKYKVEAEDNGEHKGTQS
jgi:hypothetical protein